MSWLLVLVVSLALTSHTSCELIDDLQQYEKECLGEDRFQCLGGGCVRQDQYCDGQVDCEDASDEDFCIHSHLEPKRCELLNQFTCTDGSRCIPYSWLCDNSTDCEDGSDEQKCNYDDTIETPSNATCKGFLCDGDRCISKLWVCDGQVDCKDRTDEYSSGVCRNASFPHWMHETTDCPQTQTMSGLHYRCIDSSFCLPYHMMCNGLDDCRDGSDEGPFCANWHTMCATGTPCKNNETWCYPERSGPACGCVKVKLLKYNYDTDECEDIDECAEPRPLCAQRCVNHPGFFRCKCDEGYIEDPLSYLCTAEGPEPMLFYTTGNEIRYVKVRTKEDVMVANNLKQVHGVAFDGKYLYWVETAQGHQAILKADFSDIKGTTKVLISLGLEDPGDIALDWIGGHIYFGDVARKTISACLTDGSICTTLKTNAQQPRFVTVSMKYSKVIWADWHDQRPLIMWANLDGSQSEILVDNLHSYATGLTLDEPNERLYFVDQTIQLLRIHDTKAHHLFNEPFHHPYSVSSFESSIYWSDWTSNTIQSTDKIHGSKKKRTILATHDSPVYDMHMYHPVMYKSVQNPCKNHTCSHLCLGSTPGKSVCACPDGMELHGNNCQYVPDYKPQYLIIVGGSSFTRLDFNRLGNPEAHVTQFDVGRVQALAFDSTRDTLYIYDAQDRTINYMNMSDFSRGVTHTFPYKGINDIVDMEYDPVTDNLYSLDAGRGFVEVVSLTSLKRALVYRFMPRELPLSFCLLPEYGKMLIAVWDTEQQEVYVDSIGLNGEYREHIVMTNLKGPRIRLRFDRHNDKVYIADDGNGEIYVIHPEGTGRENFRPISTTLVSMSVVDSHVYWTDRRAKLYWTNVYQASHYIRKMDLSMFSNNSQLVIQPTSVPLEKTDPLIHHPCLTKNPCSDICVQTSHKLMQAKEIKENQTKMNHTLYACLCPPGLLNIDGKCTPLANCPEGNIYCYTSNTCKKDGKICDGVIDCPHGEDEHFCRAHVDNVDRCPLGHKLCQEVCIEDWKKCNKFTTTTTPAATSTQPPIKFFKECSFEEFKCETDFICIERSQLCDGQQDCPDGSDEGAETCQSLTCQSNEFACTSRTCVLMSFKCDGEPDCPDGSDEVDCDNTTCHVGLFQCGNGACVDLKKRCDGQQDCVDAADEEGCQLSEIDEDIEPEPHCQEDEYVCEFNRSICLPPTARCNMRVECPGGTDEADCHHLCDPHGKFECAQGYQCVVFQRVCDGQKDCFDASDETPEACAKVNMTSILFRPSLFPAKQCHEGFLCDNGQCIEWRDVCDGRVQCYDGSDEGGQCDKACNNTSCDVHCFPSPRGPHCRCSSGFSLSEDGRQCIDVNECTRKECSQRCHNTVGSFLCSCHRGYALRPDRRTCKTSGEIHAVYNAGSNVWQAGTDGRTSSMYAEPKELHIADIGLDIRKNRIFVSVPEAGKLVVSNHTKSDVTITNIGHPTKLAVDWVTGLVYFADETPGVGHFKVCNVERRMCARLNKIPSGVKVTSLVVDPAAGLMFYCLTRNASSVVWSASLSGQHLTDLTSVNNCTGLAVDSYGQRLYVAEHNPARFISLDYSGQDHKILAFKHAELQGIHDLVFFEDYIFYIVSNNLNLNRCPLFGKGHCEPFLHKPVAAESFQLLHDKLQRFDVGDPCERFHCEALCVQDLLGPVCLCDDGTVASGGICPDVAYEALPLFNGWTHVQYRRAHTAVFWMILTAILASVVYLSIVGYHYLLRKRCFSPSSYAQVRFRNRPVESFEPTSPEIQMSPSSLRRHEYTNPMDSLASLKDMFRSTNRPIGTANLVINLPDTSTQTQLSDTESDQETMVSTYKKE